MIDATWDGEFEAIVRRAVPSLADEPLRGDADLQDCGLDSFGGVALLVALEQHYHVMLHDDPTVRLALATPATLWAALSELLVDF